MLKTTDSASSDSPSSNAPRPKTGAPLWETLAMFASFILLWCWFSARQNALRSNTDLPMMWTFALLIALFTMIFITVLRVKRFKRALDETQEHLKRGPLPFGFPQTPPQNKAPKK